MPIFHKTQNVWNYFRNSILSYFDNYLNLFFFIKEISTSVLKMSYNFFWYFYIFCRLLSSKLSQNFRSAKFSNKQFSRILVLIIYLLFKVIFHIFFLLHKLYRKFVITNTTQIRTIEKLYIYCRNFYTKLRRTRAIFYVLFKVNLTIKLYIYV